MSKKTAIISLISLALVGSFVTFYATNMIMSDISNMFYGIHSADMISSMPGFIFALEFIIASVFVFRLYKYPEYKKGIVRLYLLLLFIFSSIGFIFSILTGIIVYKSFITPYPFFGYTIISLIVHLCIAFFSMFLRIKYTKKLIDDSERKKIKVIYVIYNILLAFLTFLVFDKFGALLWLPSYFYFRTFYLTFPYYLSLFIPMFLMCYIIALKLGFFNDNPKVSLIVSDALFLITIGLSIAIIAIGYSHTEFISSISPTLPLERLGTKPFDAIFRGVYSIALSFYLFILAVKAYKKNKQ